MARTLWLETAYPKKTYPKLSEDAQAEVVIVGGGLSGLTTAYLLAKAGKEVILLEGKEILAGATGHTTAKLTSQHDIIYSDLINKFGEDGARAYFDANEEAIRFARDFATRDELVNADSVLFSQTKHGDEMIHHEWRAYQQLRIPGRIGKDSEIPVDMMSTLTIADQAQLHPVRFGQSLAEKAVAAGARIFEHSRVQMLNLKENKVVLENGAHVRYGKLILCTHYPVEALRGLQIAKLVVERSYAASALTDKPLKGQYLAVDQPSLSVRTAQIDGKSYLVIGGGKHEAGSKSDTEPYYESLVEKGQQLFGLSDFSHQWSAQDPQTPDIIPYVGQITSGMPDVFISTGFRKWGMSNSLVSGHILRDLIIGKDNKAIDLYAPTRSDFGSILLQALKINGMVIAEFVGGRVTRTDTPTCTHMGCKTRWNEADETWDCPCHGSRFYKDGRVMEGPATRPLEL